MKTCLSWLCDPYVHVLLVGSVLIGLAARGDVGEDAPATGAPRVLVCPRCGEPLVMGACPHLLVQ